MYTKNIMNEENNENINKDFDLLEKSDDVSFVDSNEDGDELPQKDIIKKLKEDIKALKKEKEEYLTGWQRAKADYINLQKDLEHTRLNSLIHAKEKFMKELMPVLDSFDMAFLNKEAWEKVDENWRKGVEYIYQQFITSLANLKIEKIDKINVPFDPQIHHSMETIKTEEKEKDHTLASIIQAGYIMKEHHHEQVIRPAKVNVYEYKKK